ncbi:MAG: oxidoreductase, FAD-binding, partial [Nocardia sp.]|uniref:FAD-binding oxidoreductase n=1 Tax=Nocardia sp. TaxID=1821 RepID=UPI00260B5A19
MAEALNVDGRADALITDPDQMSGYRWDHAYDPEAGMPLAVARVTCTADVQAVLRLAAEHGIAVVPRGAGTGLSGGSTAQNGCVVLSTERMR